MAAPHVRRRLPAPLLVALLPLTACAPSDDAEAFARDSDGGQVSADGTLGTPTATFPEDFGAIQTVRELGDGTVLVADPLGGALYHVDLEAGTRSQIGTEGQGPEEYRQPDAVWALPGDSTLLVDLGNGRMITMGPDLGFGPTSPLSSGDPRSGLVVAIPQGVDADGNVYSRSMGAGMGSLPDSGAVLRVERGSLAIDTIAQFKLADRVRTVSGGPNNQSVSIQQVPLSMEDAWGVAPDGSVVVARSGDYHVEWFGADGTMTAGPAVAYDPVSIGTPEKEEWVDSQGRTGGGIGISIEMTDGGAMRTSFSRGGGGMTRQREISQYQWPDVKPPFDSGRIVVDGGSRAWIRRHMPAGEDTTYDVFDRSGARVDSYALPGDRRIVGFGDGTVYVVTFDDFDLNYLERYSMPR